jgi:2',3'-cyclic-nucleotide 2'-phosphodiesterase (5'-nucleotidase family)
LRLGLPKLKVLEDEANFDFLSSNTFYEDNKEKHVFEPYKIIQKGEMRFGFIGLASNPPEKVDNIYVKNPIAAYKETYEEIKHKCDYVIALIALNSTDVYNFVRSDIKADLIISADQYRYSKYLSTEQGKTIALTDNSGKKIIKISGLVEDKEKGLNNSSQPQYRLMINNKRLERYQNIAGQKTIEEHYKDQPRVIKTVNRIKKDQQEIADELENMVNPLTFDVIEIGLDVKQNPVIKEKMEKYRAYIKTENKDFKN